MTAIETALAFIAPMIWTRYTTDRPRVFRYTTERYSIERSTAHGWRLTIDQDVLIGRFRTLADAKNAADADLRARVDDDAAQILTDEDTGEQAIFDLEPTEPARAERQRSTTTNRPNPAATEQFPTFCPACHAERDEDTTVCPRCDHGRVRYNVADTLPTFCDAEGHAYPEHLDACPHCATNDARRTDTTEIRDDVDTEDATADPVLVVIPCSAGKLNHHARARDLYATSANFRHTLRAAEAEAAATERDMDAPARVVILSAKYGLLELDDVIEPYDVTMTDRGSVEALEIADQLRALHPAEVALMLPADYRDRFIVALEFHEEITGDHITHHDAYEDAPGIGYQRAVASALTRAADVELDTSAPEADTIDQARAELLRLGSIARDRALTPDEFAAYEAAGRAINDEQLRRDQLEHDTAARDERARQLHALPTGTTVWAGYRGYRKTHRGNWSTITSGPERYTSADIATMHPAYTVAS